MRSIKEILTFWGTDWRVDNPIRPFGSDTPVVITTETLLPDTLRREIETTIAWQMGPTEVRFECFPHPPCA